MKLDLNQVVFATHSAQKKREKALRVALTLSVDPEREARLAKGLCPVCHYLRPTQLVMHAFKDWSCGLCAKVATHPNSGVPKLCLDCATHHGLCCECAADIDLAPRAKLTKPAKRRRGR